MNFDSTQAEAKAKRDAKKAAKGKPISKKKSKENLAKLAEQEAAMAAQGGTIGVGGSTTAPSSSSSSPSSRRRLEATRGPRTYWVAPPSCAPTQQHSSGEGLSKVQILKRRVLVQSGWMHARHALDAGCDSCSVCNDLSSNVKQTHFHTMFVCSAFAQLFTHEVFPYRSLASTAPRGCSPSPHGQSNGAR